MSGYGYAPYGSSEFGYGNLAPDPPPGEFWLLAVRYRDEKSVTVTFSARAQERGPGFDGDVLDSESWIITALPSGDPFFVTAIEFDDQVDGEYHLVTSEPMVTRTGERLRVSAPDVRSATGQLIHPDHDTVERKMMEAPDRASDVLAVRDQDWRNRMDQLEGLERDGAMLASGASFQVENGLNMYRKWVARIVARGIPLRHKEMAADAVVEQAARTLQDILSRRTWVESADVSAVVGDDGHTVNFQVRVWLAKSTRSIEFEVTDSGLLVA